MPKTVESVPRTKQTPSRVWRVIRFFAFLAAGALILVWGLVWLDTDRAQIMATLIVGMGATAIALAQFSVSQQREREEDRRRKQSELFEAPVVVTKTEIDSAGFMLKLSNTGLTPARDLRVQFHGAGWRQPADHHLQVGTLSPGDHQALFLPLSIENVDSFFSRGQNQQTPLHRVELRWNAQHDSAQQNVTVLNADLIRYWRLRERNDQQHIDLLEHGEQFDREPLSTKWPALNEIKQAKIDREHAERLIAEANGEAYTA